MKKLFITIISCAFIFACEEKPRTVSYKIDQYISTEGFLVTKTLRKDSDMLISNELDVKIDKITTETNYSIMLIRRQEAEAIIDKFIKIEKYDRYKPARIR